MGREIKRVPLDFDWPIGETWLAYAVHVKFPQCPDCEGRGITREARAIQDTFRGFDFYEQAKAECERLGVVYQCPRCEGHGDMATPELREWAETMPDTPIPKGDGYQLWETVGDSPMSPVYATPEELATWMATNPWMMGPNLSGPLLVPTSYDDALNFIGIGWAPSLVTYMGPSGGTVTDGVTAVLTDERWQG